MVTPWHAPQRDAMIVSAVVSDVGAAAHPATSATVASAATRRAITA
jgi:hypothetical protein